MSNKTRIVTGKVRLSYANIWEAKALNEGAKPKYSTSIIIPKTDKETIKKINDAINCAIEEGIGKFGGKKPNIKVLKTPLRDGDLERSDDEAYIEANRLLKFLQYFIELEDTSDIPSTSILREFIGGSKIVD